MTVAEDHLAHVKLAKAEKRIAILEAALRAFVAHDTDDPDFICNGQVHRWIFKTTFEQGRAALSAGKHE